MNIKIGFSTSNNFISKTIRFFTRSKISHTFLLLDKAFMGEDMVMQATKGGFNLVTYSVFKQHNKIVELVEPGVSLVEGIKVATRWLGRDYDYLGVVGFLFVLLGRIFSLRWRNPFNTDAVFCSEVIVYILKSSNYPGAESLNPSTITPQDLYEFLKKD